MCKYLLLCMSCSGFPIGVQICNVINYFLDEINSSDRRERRYLFQDILLSEHSEDSSNMYTLRILICMYTARGKQ